MLQAPAHQPRAGTSPEEPFFGKLYYLRYSEPAKCDTIKVKSIEATSKRTFEKPSMQRAIHVSDILVHFLCDFGVMCWFGFF